MAGNTVENVNVTAEEIAAVLSAELQKTVVQIISLRIENDKLKERIRQLAENQNKF